MLVARIYPRNLVPVPHWDGWIDNTPFLGFSVSLLYFHAGVPLDLWNKLLSLSLRVCFLGIQAKNKRPVIPPLKPEKVFKLNIEYPSILG